MSDIFSLPQLVGYLAFLFGVISFLQRDERRFKILMAMECLAYIVHFILLQKYPPLASLVLSFLRSILSLYTRSLALALAIIGTNILVTCFLAHTWTDFFPLAASTLGTLALFRLSGIPMRLLMLGGTLLWLGNNILAGSYGGTALEATLAVVNLITIFRLQRSKKAAVPNPPDQGLEQGPS